jgi:hypothetical protein
MYSKSFKIFILLGIFFIFSTGKLLASELVKTEEKRFPLSNGGSISLAADEGFIMIKSWDKDEVYLKMTKVVRARNRHDAERLMDALQVHIQQSRERLSIRELDRYHNNRFSLFDLFDGEFWRHGSIHSYIDFELTVPRNVNLKLRCDEGDVDVTDVRGEMLIEVDEGDVTLEKIVSNRVQVNLDEGDVIIAEAESQDYGHWKIATDEGHISVEEGQISELDASSDEGDIYLRDLTLSRFWLITDEGDIICDFSPHSGREYHLETDEGDLEITIPDHSNLDVKLITYEGSIDSDFKLPRRRYDDGEIMEGQIGQRGPKLKAVTDEGDILFLKNR